MIVRKKLHRFLIVTAFAWVALTGMNVQAEAGEYQYVDDKADLLTDEEEEDLSNMCVEYSTLYDLDMAIVTSDDMENRYFKDYAKNYYLECGYTNGFLLLIDMEDRKVFILSAGTGNDWVPDTKLNDFDDETAAYLKSGQYYDGCVAYIENIVGALDGIGYDDAEEGPYYGDDTEEDSYYEDDYETEVYENEFDIIGLFMHIVISAGCAALLTFLLVKFLGGTDGNTSSSAVYRIGNARLLGHRDIFIREEVTRTKRSTDNDSNSGGGSGGSSGGDFGGSDGADF